MRGILLAAAHASRDGHELIVPAANADEALVARHDPRACSVTSDGGLRTSHGRAAAAASQLPDRNGFGRRERHCGAEPDLSDVRGQLQAKRALLIAAAGGHSLLMIGPPGCGKSMLAQRLPGPAAAAHWRRGARLRRYRVGQRRADFNMSGFGRRPFRSPHHTASAVSLVGGGSQRAPRRDQPRSSRRVVPR